MKIKLCIVRALLIALVVNTAVKEKEIVSAAGQQQCSDSSSSSPCTNRNYYHLLVLVHGYKGSEREQEYLGEALMEKSTKIKLSSSTRSRHQFVVLYSKANTHDTTDGVVEGGQRLGAEISDWIQHHTDEMKRSESSPSTVMTLSLIGNSLGGLYIRHASAELQNMGVLAANKILPLIFCTTSSPHLGVSQETFVALPSWTEPLVGSAMKQTGNDLFGVNDSTIVNDMCFNRTYLRPLRQFQKRIAVANAFNTDFLVSVSSGGFLDSESNSMHHRLGLDDESDGETATRPMKNTEHVALQVFTTVENDEGADDDVDKKPAETTSSRSDCADSLDRLGWHKIFLDTRNMLPDMLQLSTPDFPIRERYASKDLLHEFNRYGTLLPLAHPLNMANSRTDWYRMLTKRGQPIMDSLAELLVLDMIELSEKATQ